jgi:hypothetical protein
MNIRESDPWGGIRTGRVITSIVQWLILNWMSFNHESIDAQLSGFQRNVHNCVLTVFLLVNPFVCLKRAGFRVQIKLEWVDNEHDIVMQQSLISSFPCRENLPRSAHRIPIFTVWPTIRYGSEIQSISTLGVISLGHLIGEWVWQISESIPIRIRLNWPR